ncbi:hypothetical protein BCD64_11225 [Nostoc sp. MBR 210]|uniref:Lipoprotein n=1 Tax=Nostoc spongiaeforme FACHB-130 TaxID=1357510 RepID=A0ABR8FUJ2_9NOSO|nr:hypothetical protein [Nostoc spongiaeforme]MBD2594753.1 hypothetical protein [Nostoc spongiaeforme FACHB-130]OCQ91583.1 hypothetical protein BCD64_11225 [Nostoc sp. MBR 210]
MKSQVYRKAAITAFCLGLLGLLMGCLDLSVSFETANPDTSDTASTNTSQSKRDSELPILDAATTPTNVSNTTTIPINQVEPSTSQVQDILVNRPNGAGSTKIQGTLRMSNQTDQPVRLALLARKLKGKSSTSSKTNDISAHWDFAPQEGSSKGLLLSLPNGNLKLEKGDILVAFAQDGSRRYWGPYVVGESSLPTLNAETKEWLLVLSP